MRLRAVAGIIQKKEGMGEGYMLHVITITWIWNHGWLIENLAWVRNENEHIIRLLWRQREHFKIVALIKFITQKWLPLLLLAIEERFSFAIHSIPFYSSDV